MATVSINLSTEFDKLIHRPMYKGVVCYTHPEGYGGGSNGDNRVNNQFTVKNDNLNKMGFTVLDGDGQVDATEVVKATRSYMNSPGNIRRLYFTYRGIVVLYYTSFIEKGQRSNRGHWVARSFPSGLDLKEVFFKMLSYQSDYNRYRMEKQVNKNAKEPTKYTIIGSLLRRIDSPWMLSNVEEVYFDWVGLLSSEQGTTITPDRSFPNKYNIIYNILNGKVPPQIASTLDFVQTLMTATVLGPSGGVRGRGIYPRLRTITFVSNLGDLLFDPSIPIDKVDSEFTDVSKAGVMWYRSPQNVEIFKRTGSVVWYYDITKDLKVRNKNFSKKPGIYLFDEKYLSPVFDSYVQKINDYNNKLKYGDKGEESTEEDKVESSETTSSRLDELVDRVVKARGPQVASYILRVAATGYSSKEIHGLIKSASESNQPAIKRYMGVN